MGKKFARITDKIMTKQPEKIDLAQSEAKRVSRKHFVRSLFLVFGILPIAIICGNIRNIAIENPDRFKDP